MADTIMNRGTIGDFSIKGITAKVLEIMDQAGQAYSLAMPSALGVEANKATALWKPKTTINAQETVEGTTGVGYLEHTPEGSDYPQDSFTSTYKTELTPAQFSKKITFTKIATEDMILDKGLDRTRKLTIAGMQTQNQHAFDIFNKAFTAQASLPEYLSYYGDGKPVCSTIHPIKASITSNTTQSNASPNGIPLTDANLALARQYIRRQTDDKDMPSSIGGGRLILLVPDSLEEYAYSLTKSKKRPETANNDINVADSVGYTVMSSKWLNSQNGGSDTQWFLIDSMNSPLIFLTRIALSLEKPNIDRSNGNLEYVIRGRWVVGNTDWRGIWGSKGDAISYSS